MCWFLLVQMLRFVFGALMDGKSRNPDSCNFHQAGHLLCSQIHEFSFTRTSHNSSCARDSTCNFLTLNNLNALNSRQSVKILLPSLMQPCHACFLDSSDCVFTASNLRLRCSIKPSAYLPASVSCNVHPLVIAADPQEPSQFAAGLSDGGVRVFEPLNLKASGASLPQLKTGHLAVPQLHLLWVASVQISNKDDPKSGDITYSSSRNKTTMEMQAEESGGKEQKSWTQMVTFITLIMCIHSMFIAASTQLKCTMVFSY